MSDLGQKARSLLACVALPRHARAAMIADLEGLYSPKAVARKMHELHQRGYVDAPTLTTSWLTAKGWTALETPLMRG